MTQTCGICPQESVWTDAWAGIEQRSDRSIAKSAERWGVLEFHLRLRALLQLPRHAWHTLLSGPALDEEIESAAEHVASAQRDFRELMVGRSVTTLTRASASIDDVPEMHARLIHERFHYLGSFHSGRHFGLYLGDETRPAALATISPMDVVRFQHYMSEGRYHRSVLLSRVFAFPWAPKNSLSWLLGCVARHLRREGKVDNMLTWVNPNLCFHASSYRAANWQYVGSEPVVYRYVDGAYVTARQLYEMGNISSSRLSFSQFLLTPLEVWGYQIH